MLHAKIWFVFNSLRAQSLENRIKEIKTNKKKRLFQAKEDIAQLPWEYKLEK